MRRRSWTCFSGHGSKVMGALILGAASLISSHSSAQTQRYTVVELGTLSQGNVSIVRGPNGIGEGVGAGTETRTKPSGPRRGLVFRRGAAAEQVAGLTGGDDTSVFALNDN